MVAHDVSTAHPRPLRLGKGTEDEQAPFRPEIDDFEDVRLVVSKESCLRWSLNVALLVALWWTVAVFIAMMLKRTVGSPGARHAPGPFPYPFALTCFVNAVTTPMCLVLSCVIERRSLSRPRMTRRECLILLLIGFLQGLELGCNNKATEFLPVSMKTMMHSMFVLFVMLSAKLWGIEHLGCLRTSAAFLILCGGVLQGFSVERERFPRAVRAEHGHGALLMLVAMVLGAQRWVLIQVVVHSSSTSGLGHLSKLQFSVRTLPVAGFVCFVGALVFEEHAFSHAAADESRQALLFAIPCIGASIIVLTLSELSVVRRTSAVALQVLATLHQIPIVVVSVVMFQENIGPLSVVGFAFCIGAAFLYALARRREKRATAEDSGEALEQEDMSGEVGSSATGPRGASSGGPLQLHGRTDANGIAL